MEKSSLRIVFMGTPEFAVGTLRALVEGGYRVVAVVTQPDKPVGRHGSVLRAPAVKEYALSVGLPVLQPEKMKDADFVEQLRAYDADLQVVVAFRMLPETVWAMPRLGTFNVHASLLPEYRGAAPINWAVINGETVTGVTTFFLDEQMDTGRIILQKKFDIPGDADVEYVYDGLMRLGAEAAVETVERIILFEGAVPTVLQEKSIESGSSHTYSEALQKTAPKIFKDSCRINWECAAKNIYDFVRGLSPVPAAWSTLVDAADGSAREFKVYKAAKTGADCGGVAAGTVRTESGRLLVATADEWIEILELQLAGKKRMAARDFLNGLKNRESVSAL